MEFIIGPFLVLSRADDGPSTAEEFHCRIVLVLEWEVRTAGELQQRSAVLLAGAHSSSVVSC